MSLFHLAVSPGGDNSRSRALALEFLASYKTAHPGANIVERDLSVNPAVYLDAETIAAPYVPEEGRNAEMQKKHAHRLDLINELLSAKNIVVSTPMWNWGIPAVLKAYIDLVLLVGHLDPFTCKKLEGKTVTILIASGGAYGPGTPNEGSDMCTPYLKQIFTSLGSTDVQAFRTELTMAGVMPGMENLVPLKEKSFEEAANGAKARAAAI